MVPIGYEGRGYHGKGDGCGVRAYASRDLNYFEQSMTSNRTDLELRLRRLSVTFTIREPQSDLYDQDAFSS